MSLRVPLKQIAFVAFFTISFSFFLSLHLLRCSVRTVITGKSATYASSEINELKIRNLSKSLIVHFGATESISIGKSRRHQIDSFSEARFVLHSDFCVRICQSVLISRNNCVQRQKMKRTFLSKMGTIDLLVSVQ